MRNFFIQATCLFAVLLNGNTDTFSKDRLIEFYEEFLLDQREELALSGLTTHASSSRGPYSTPSNPPPPAFQTGLLPIVLVNNSGLPDNEVYVLITGKNYDTPSLQVWGSVNTSTGVVTLQPVSNSDNGSTFSCALSSLPTSSTGRVLYLPQTKSGLIWFSALNKLSMPVTSNTIVQPSFTNPTDPNYDTNFDIFEFTYDQTPDIFADATAVSFFSIPLYGYLAGATSTSSNTGLYQPRSYIMEQATASFAKNALTATSRAQWGNLFLTSGDTILRLLSTGKAMAASLFDANYLDDSASYDFSFINDIWSGGSSSYYAQHTLPMTVEVTSPSSATYNYTGQVNTSTNQFVFTSSNGGPTVTFPAPTTSPTPTGTTSYEIFSAINLVNQSATAGSATDAVSKLFEEALIAGLLPTTNTLTIPYLTSNQGIYYTINTNLPANGQTSGPWYDLYSKALHSLGSIYTFGFDEPLWPQVLLKAPFTNGSTYLGITIGPLD